MNIINIKRMWWSDVAKTSVGVLADTDNEEVLIGTPYSEESNIWNKISTFPIENIEDYTPPPPPDPATKLEMFLKNNPDVVEFLKFINQQPSNT